MKTERVHRETNDSTCSMRSTIMIYLDHLLLKMLVQLKLLQIDLSLSQKRQTIKAEVGRRLVFAKQDGTIPRLRNTISISISLTLY